MIEELPGDIADLDGNLIRPGKFIADQKAVVKGIWTDREIDARIFTVLVRQARWVACSQSGQVYGPKRSQRICTFYAQSLTIETVIWV